MKYTNLHAPIIMALSSERLNLGSIGDLQVSFANLNISLRPRRSSEPTLQRSLLVPRPRYSSIRHYDGIYPNFDACSISPPSSPTSGEASTPPFSSRRKLSIAFDINDKRVYTTTEEPFDRPAEPLDSPTVSESERTRYEQLPFNKMPIINIVSSSYKTLRTDKIIKDLQLHGIHDFAFNQLNAKRTFIETADDWTYRQIMKYLDSVQIPYFTYTPKKERFKSFVMHGLLKGTHHDKLVKDLQQYETNSLRIVRVIEYKDYPVRKHTRKLQPYIVQIDVKSSRRELFAIRNILNCCVYWEAFIRQKVLQCHRCQRLGHTTVNCRLPYRCVKCGQSHFKKPCTLGDNIPQESLFCALCGQVGHPASYRGCPKFVQAENLRHYGQIEKTRAERLEMRRIKRKAKREAEKISIPADLEHLNNVINKPYENDIL